MREGRNPFAPASKLEAGPRNGENSPRGDGSMHLLLKWLILGWSLVVVLLWGFLSFRQWQSGEALFASGEDLFGFMALVFLTWLVPVAVFAFFAFLAKPKKP
jgi:hypothetical protein